MSSVYLFSVTPETPPIETIESGDEVSLVVRGAFADVEDIRTVPTPFTPACDGHPLAPRLRADPGQRGGARGRGPHRHPRDGRPRGRDDRDPPRLRGPAARVRGSEAPPVPGARREGVVRRPGPAAPQPEPRHRLDDAAGRLQAVLRGRVRRRLRPEGRRCRKPHPPPGHGAGRDGVLRRSARRDQRRDHHRDGASSAPRRSPHGSPW